MDWGSDPSRASSNRPAVAVTTNGAIGVVWRDNVERAEEGTDRDIYLRLYGTGSAMSVIETVSNFVNPVLDGNSENVSVSPASNGGLHIVWQDDGALDQDTDVESDIYYRNHDGQSLGTNALLVSQSAMGAGSGPDEQDYRSIYPDVAVDGRGVAHVVWQDNGDLDGDGDTDYDIYYASGGPAGFNQPTLISDALPGLDGVSVRPRIAITPDNCPHVVWQDDGQIDMSDTDMLRDIYYRGSTPNMAGGCTWSLSFLSRKKTVSKTSIVQELLPTQLTHEVSSTSPGMAPVTLSITALTSMSLWPISLSLKPQLAEAR